MGKKKRGSTKRVSPDAKIESDYGERGEPIN